MVSGKIDRRRFVQAAGTAGILSFAGCVGDEEDINGADIPGDTDPADDDTDPDPDPEPDDDAEFDVVMVSSGEETATYAMTQGIAAVVNEHSDSVFLDARPSPGTDANVGLVDRNEASIGLTQSWSALLMADRESPFDDLSFEPVALMQNHTLPWVLHTTHLEWDMATDIETGTTGFLTPPGSGTLPPLEKAMEAAGYVSGDDYEVAGIGFGDQSGAYSEGRLDWSFNTYMNWAVFPAYVQEMASIHDMKLLDFPDDVVEEANQVGGFSMEPVDTTDIQDMFPDSPDEIWAPTLPYYFFTSREMEYDAVYELMSVMHTHAEEMADFHALLGEFTDDEHWARIPIALPFHPAAADFLEEIGQWRDDEMERAD